MQFTRTQIIFLIISGIAALILALVLVGILPGIRYKQDVTTITFWGVDEPKVWTSTIANFKKARPDLEISYERIAEDKYETRLINAMALGESPDIFMFENNWLLKHGDKIAPASPEKVTVNNVKQLFPQVVEDDFVVNNQVYALPLYIDTLAMVYNRALFDQGRVVFPPQTWDEVALVTNQLKIVEGEQIKRAAFALGGAKENIDNAGDLISALILQNGGDMINSNFDRAAFSNREGRDAFAIYNRFVDSNSSAYTWNASMRADKESFIRGDVAAIFVYASEARDISMRNSFLDISIAPLPQIDPTKAVNVADYWGLTVSGRSRNQSNAWDFVVFATTNTDIASSYLYSTGRPPALRTLINEALNDPSYGVFVTQALTARSWLQLGEESFQNALSGAASAVLSGELTSARALDRAESIITEELQSR